MTERQAANRNGAPRSSAPSGAAVMALLGAALLAGLPAKAAPSAAVRLAVFEFELEDFSAGASSRETQADIEHLARVTDEVRQLLSNSGQYDLVDVGAADSPVVNGHTLRHCDGCEAAIALELGAEQSFVGVVRRITRTEYQVRFQLRDARTGTIVAEGNSGLRMGADYSWSRGAVRLVKDRLLEGRP